MHKNILLTLYDFVTKYVCLVVCCQGTAEQETQSQRVVRWKIKIGLTSFALVSSGRTLKSRNHSSPQAKMKDKRTSVTSKVKFAAVLH